MSTSIRAKALLGFAVLTLALPAVADPGQAPAGTPARPKAATTNVKPRWRTLTGEIVDMGCYTARGFKGAFHRDCGMQCVRSGVPKGLLTAGDTVYVLTENHDRAMAPTQFPPPNPFVLCNDWVSLQVEIQGFVWEGEGTRFLEVRTAKRLSPG